MKEKENGKQHREVDEIEELKALLEQLKRLKNEVSECKECKSLEERLVQLEKAFNKEKGEEVRSIKKELNQLRDKIKKIKAPLLSNKLDEKKLKGVADKGRKQAALEVEKLVKKAVPPFLR